MKNRYNYTPADLNFQSVPLIRAALDELQTDKLQQLSPAAFEQGLRRYLNNEIKFEEKYHDERDAITDTFYWGHDHDFGAFQLSGMMGTRHIWMLSRFFDHLGLPLTAIKSQQILDVGCWTGGASLALNKLGGKITAIDKRHKYVHALAYLSDSFNLADLTCHWLSLYDLEPTASFDIVFCLGVIYHVTDPIVALRRIYHVMKPDAWLCLESMSIDSDRRICEYEGPAQKRGAFFSGNWFIPSPPTLFQWLADTGFEDIQVGNGLYELAVTNTTDPMGANRCFALARRKAHHVMAAAGLSIHLS